jgi:hypothetical protein
MAPKRVTSTTDPLVEEIRERFTYGHDEWADIREEARKDMRFLTGDCWDPRDRKEREDAGRPCLSLDELSQYVNQAVNRERQHKRGIIVTATGYGANEETARFRQSLYRQIEYESNAQTEAYITMFQNTVERSYGFLRIAARYVNDRTFEQKLVIEPIPNPELVTIDPDAIRTEGSDMAWGFIHENRAESEFLREWPDADVKDFRGGPHAAPLWFKKKGRVQIAEYWRRITRPRKLLRLKPAPATPDDPRPQPQDVFVDELTAQGGEPVLPPSDMILMERTVHYPVVERYFTNGMETLLRPGTKEKATVWPGKSIPIVPCYGKVVWVEEDGEVRRKILSLIRLARDPAMLYCFYRTNEAELVGMTPKTPFVGYEGQFDGHEDEWATINKEPRAYLEVKATIEGLPPSAPLPLPQRQPYDPPIQALEMGAESARRAIQSAIAASPLPTQAQRQNEKSGVALERIDTSAETGSFHFADHFNASLQRVGALLDELAPHYYDTERDVAVREADDAPKMRRINDASAPQPVHMDEDHAHDVTISTGPSVESERVNAEEFADLLAQSPAGPAVMDLIVRLRNLGPIGDEIAERLTPPQFKKSPELDKMPPDAARAVMAANAKVQELGQQLQQAVEHIKTEQGKQQGEALKAKLAADTALRVQVLRNAAAIAIAKINALTKGIVAAQEGHDEAVALAEQQMHEAEQGAFDRTHEALLAQMSTADALQKGQVETAHTAALAEQAHEHARDLASANAGHAQELAATTASLAPAPAADESGGM